MKTTMRRDWAGRTTADCAIAYIDRTGTDVSMFDKAIVEACANGGVLPEELADMFVLTCPAGVWILDWA